MVKGLSIFSKTENNLLRKLVNCKTKKCSKLLKEKHKEEKKYTKEEKIKCTQKSSKKFYDCSAVLYDKSKYKVLSKKYYECGEKKCSKEHKNLKKYRNKSRKI